ncbi:hypothetical protein P9112_005497 [Eukaryota sp. TZLM1-RC]
MGSKPGYFPIDTRTLWGIGKTAMGNLDGKPRFKQVQNYMCMADIGSLTHNQQNSYWDRWLNTNNKSFTKNGFKFNNYAVTNGISICFQFVREDLAGLTFKPDSNIAKVSVSYFDHLDPEDYSDKNVVFGDLGKRDLIQFGAQSKNPFQIH